MIIEIDDAGTGSPVGGIVIGALKNGRFSYKVIPVELFRTERNESIKKVKEAVLEAVLELLKILDFNQEEDFVRICRGDIFSLAHSRFDELEFHWERAKIESKLQDLVETAYDFHLVELGVPRMLVKRLLDYRHYVVELLKWVVIDMKNRERFVKTRFPIWRHEWVHAELSFEWETARKNAYCIECGEKIERGEKRATVIIKTPKRRFITYLHETCADKLSVVK